MGMKENNWRYNEVSSYAVLQDCEQHSRGEKGKGLASYKYWLSCLTFLAGKKKICLEAMFGGAREIYHAEENDISNLPFLTDREKELLKEAKKQSLGKLLQELDDIENAGIRLVTWQEEEYPGKLKEIYNPPYGLFCRGKLPDERQKAVGVVGARICSSYGKIIAEKIGQGLAKAGVAVISGMASGVDGAAQSGALLSGGYSCGVLGCGIDVCYPAMNRKLYDDLIQAGGLLSESPPHAKPHAMYFPQRNRIISGLSDCILVVEAKKRSGSLITVDFALEQGKDIYAVPGRICDALSYGTNCLIQQGAGVFLNMEDFLREMHIFAESGENSSLKQKNHLENLERLVYSCLDLSPRSIEELLKETGMPLGALMENLETLQEKGCVSEIYRNYYIRSDVSV